MNALQKKCFLASATIHVAAAALLLLAPLIIPSKKRTLNLPVLTLIPTHLIDEAFSGGGSPRTTAAQPPPVIAPPVTVPPAAVTPAPPAAETKQPDLPRPEPPKPKPIERPITQAKAVAKPAVRDEITPKIERPAPEVNLKLTRRPPPPKSAAAAAPNDAAKRAAEAAKARQSEIANNLENLTRNLSGITSFDVPGTGGGPAYANYAQAIKSIYANAWLPPEDFNDEAATVQAEVTVARDGRVVNARVIKRSGTSDLDRSVERALARVRSLPAFPEGARDEQRVFHINFNLKAKRLTG